MRCGGCESRQGVRRAGAAGGLEVRPLIFTASSGPHAEAVAAAPRNDNGGAGEGRDGHKRGGAGRGTVCLSAGLTVAEGIIDFENINVNECLQRDNRRLVAAHTWRNLSQHVGVGNGS